MIGERRFLGLYTHTAYHASPREIPILRRKVEAVLARAAFPADSHNEKALIEILESYPRDELFQISVDDLYRDRDGDPAPRASASGCACSCAATPSTASSPAWCSCRATASTRRTAAASSGSCGERSARRAIDYTTRVSESVLVRLHYLAYIEPGPRCPDFDEREIETLLVAATRSWGDDLEEALIEEHGEERGNALFRRYGDAFPAGLPGRLGAALGGRRHRPHRGAGRARRPRAAASTARSRRRDGALRAKLFRSGRRSRCRTCCRCSRTWAWRSPTSAPTRSRRATARAVWIYDFGLTYAGDDELEADRVRERFQDAFVRAWRGDIESDGYNRLVLRAGLDVARGHGAARGRPLPAPGRHDVQRPLHRAGAGGAPATWRACSSTCSRRASTRAAADAETRRAPRARASSRRSTPSRASTRTASCATSSTSCGRCCARTTSSATPTGRRKPYLSFKLDPEQLPGCRCPARASRSSSTRRAPRACTCAAARSRAAGSAGRTGARTSAPRCSG